MATLTLGNISLLIPICMISDYAKDRYYSLIGCTILGFWRTFMIPLDKKYQ